ncbi:MAG: hypothetical protein AB7G23_10405 [Vicinamibacterales bacterium]
MLACGPVNYVRAARRAVASVLAWSPFDVVVALDPARRWRWPLDARVTVWPLPADAASADRARPFLRKFEALRGCLARTSADLVLLLDADAMVAAPMDAPALETALAGHGLGMVEQTTIIGSTMDRAAFLGHYVRHALAWFDPALPVPTLAAFRYFNSGVVVGRRDALADVTAWALGAMAGATRPHQVGAHMIADQDYFQVWANSLHPDSCTTLPWAWNHCEHWDAAFPREGARILHFSNFCNGPTLRQVARMEAHLPPAAGAGRLAASLARRSWAAALRR